MKRWDGVADGTRTHDDQNHNLGLYQLSYSHRRARKYTARSLCDRRVPPGGKTLSRRLRAPPPVP